VQPLYRKTSSTLPLGVCPALYLPILPHGESFNQCTSNEVLRAKFQFNWSFPVALYKPFIGTSPRSARPSNSGAVRSLPLVAAPSSA